MKETDRGLGIERVKEIERERQIVYVCVRERDGDIRQNGIIHYQK